VASYQSGQLAAALSELSPQRLEMFRNIAFDNYAFKVQRLDNYQANERDGQFGLDTTGMSVTENALSPCSRKSGIACWPGLPRPRRPAQRQRRFDDERSPDDGLQGHEGSAVSRSDMPEKKWGASSR